MSSSSLRALVSAVIVVVGLFISNALAAQSEVGSLLQNGQVIVKIYATVDQTGMPYGRPVDHFDLLLLSPSGERSTITTDGSGAATLQLRPGAYRIASSKPLEWGGEYYAWDLPLDVRPGMRAVNLTQRNATQVDASSARVALAPSAHPRDASGSGTVAEGTAKAAGAAPPAYLYKNPGEAVLFSFLIPGVGQMYNGQVGKGVALLLVSTAGAAVAISAAGSCNFSTDCNNTASEVLGGSVFLGAWIYSMVDAYSGAKQHNAKLGFRVGSIPIAPHIGEERNGRTTIGLSLAVR